MKIATISEAKNKLSQLLDWVKAGETVIIMDRDIPVARLESVHRQGDSQGRSERLIRAGIARGPVTPFQKGYFKKHPPIRIAGADILKALLDEREESR